MSSDNRALRLLQKESVKPSFQEKILKFRRKYGVPDHGFHTRKEVEMWNQKRNEEYRDVMLRSLSNYKTPPEGFVGGKVAWRRLMELDKKPSKRLFTNFDNDLISIMGTSHPTIFPLLIDYVASNKIELPIFYACTIDTAYGPFQHLKENQWKKFGMKFVKILINEDASPSSVKKYIDKEWRYIETQIRPFKKKLKQIKISKEWEQNQCVYNLSRRKKSDLESELKEYKPQYVCDTKELIIGKLMSKYGYPELSDVAVKKIIQRELKDRKEDN